MDDSSSSSGGSDSSSSSSGNDSPSNDSTRDESTQSTDRSDSTTDNTTSVEDSSDSPDVTARSTLSHRSGSTDTASHKPASPGNIILQWLTYAFWGWTILSLVWLVFIVVANVMTTQDTSGMVPYAIAASLVLLPIAVVCDIFYLRHEPVKKHGASMVVMVIHAVIFALCGIGVLITGVLTLVQLSIGTTSDHTGLITWVITAAISTLVYLLTFVRTLNPFAKSISARWYWISMVVIVGGFIIAGFVGPVAQARLAQDDRDIEDNLNLVADRISAKVERTGELPNTLSDVELTTKQKELVDKGLLTYIKEAPETKAKMFAAEEDFSSTQRYQLCTTFKRQSSYYSDKYDASREEYSTYISASSHPAGKVCYKVEAAPVSN